MAISRGGLVPAVMLSHYLDVRDLRVLTVVHTVDDGVYAAKTGTACVCRPQTLGCRLLQPFQQLDERRAHQGHGHGLSIVQAIGTAHGAVIGARALSGGGLAVDVKFPIQYRIPQSPTGRVTIQNGAPQSGGDAQGDVYNLPGIPWTMATVAFAHS